MSLFKVIPDIGYKVLRVGVQGRAGDCVSGVIARKAFVVRGTVGKLACRIVIFTMRSLPVPFLRGLIKAVKVAVTERHSEKTYIVTRAYWYAATGEMIDYCAGNSIAVTVTEPSVENTYGLCHTIVKTLRNNLQAK